MSEIRQCWHKPRIRVTSLWLELIRLLSHRMYDMPVTEFMRNFFGDKNSVRICNIIGKEALERSSKMAGSYPYTMTSQTLAAKNMPYQIQQFVSETDPPVCQDYMTYLDATLRICEIMANPKCLMTGKPIIALVLVKRVEPQKLIEMDIDPQKINEELTIKAVQNLKYSDTLER